MSERALANRVMKALKPLHAIRVENPCHPGTPDVDTARGWIELKQVDSWPKRASTPLRLPHFTPQQKIWLDKRTRAGGRCWVLVQVEREYFLLSGATASTILGEATREQLFEASLFWCDSHDLEKELMDALCDTTDE